MRRNRVMAMKGNASTTRSERRFIAAAMGYPLLAREREVALSRRWLEKRDERALHELTASHTRLVVRIASAFRASGLPVADLIQEGNVGLMEAAERFDPDRNVRFSTYASWWIVAAIQNFILRNSSIVRVATTPKQRRLFFSLRRLRARYATGFDGALSGADRERIADKLGVTADDVAKMEAHLARPDQSLNATLGHGESLEQQDLLASAAPSPEDVVGEAWDDAVRAAWIDQALARLTPRERHIVNKRFLEDRRMTLAEIGQSFGVSKERIRQIETRALKKMHAALMELVNRPGEVFDL